LEDFGLSITEYRVYRQRSDEPPEVVGVMEASMFIFIDTEVMVGEGYQYYVTAVNAKGESLPSQVIHAMVMVPPGKPTAVEAVAYLQFVKITWAPPVFDGASPVLGYQLYLVGEGGEAIGIGGKNIVDIGEVQLAFLHDVQYDGIVRGYFVTAFNVEGEGEPSDTATTSVYDVPTDPRDLTVEWGDEVLSLGWQTPESNGGIEGIGFTVYRKAAGEDEPTKMVMVPISTLSFIDENVENGVEYTYTVTCTNIVGEGSHSSPVSGVPAGLPSEPQGVAAEGLDGSVRVSWQPPRWDGGRDIVGYLVYSVTDGTSLREIAQVGPDAGEFVEDGLANGQIYVFAVKAVTIVGSSDISGLTEARPLGPPSEPMDIQAFWMEDHLLLTWDVPEDDGGSPVLGYMLIREDWEGTNWTQVLDPTFRDLDVERGNTYNYTIYAYTGAGDGPVAKVTFTIPKEEEPPVEPEAIGWTYLVLLVVLLAISIAVLYNGLRKRAEVSEDRRE
jgi:fibronectin type 3 domain-containing protein